jgi:hypothetical protein
MAARVQRDGGASRDGLLAVRRQASVESRRRRDGVAEAVFLMGLATAPDIWASGGVGIGTETLSTPRTTTTIECESSAQGGPVGVSDDRVLDRSQMIDSKEGEMSRVVEGARLEIDCCRAC